MVVVEKSPRSRVARARAWVICFFWIGAWACACTPTAAAPDPAAPLGTPPGESSAATPADAPVEARFDWLVERIDAMQGEGAQLVDADAYAEHFGPEFVGAVTLEQLSALLAPVGAQGPLEAACTVRSDATHVQRHVVSASGESAWLLTLAIDEAAPHAIEGFRIAPAPWLVSAGELGDVAALEAALRALGPQVSLVAGEVVDGELREVFAVEPDAPLAVGSAFKLWVLAALADEVEAGRRRWDDTLVVDDAQRSLSSLHLDKVEHGTALTLESLAGSMIEVSDNTATDMLVLELGRPAVEAAMRASGHASPERNEPLLTTRDMFWLKLQAAPEALESYLAADAAGRRAVLEPGVPFELGQAYWKATGWTAPRQIDAIEWFASGRDLARALEQLRARSESPGLEPVLSILSRNPGLTLCGGWSGFLFKGGSEPGVLNLSWLLRRGDERVFALVMTVNDPGALIDEASAFGVAFAAAQLLGATP